MFPFRLAYLSHSVAQFQTLLVLEPALSAVWKCELRVIVGLCDPHLFTAFARKRNHYTSYD